MSPCLSSERRLGPKVPQEAWNTELGFSLPGPSEGLGPEEAGREVRKADQGVFTAQLIGNCLKVKILGLSSLLSVVLLIGSKAGYLVNTVWLTRVLACGLQDALLDG